MLYILCFILNFLFIQLIYGDEFTSCELTFFTAANFEYTLKKLSFYYDRHIHKCKINIIAGATSVLTQEIIHGANADIFFAADQEHINILKKAGTVLNKINQNKNACNYYCDGSYAIGKLILFSREQFFSAKDNPYAIINQSSSANDKLYIAIANPNLAPYGAAAKIFLEKVNASWDKYNSMHKLLIGENVNQAFNYTASNSVKYAIIDLAHGINYARIFNPENKSLKNYLIINSALYNNILRQDFAILNSSKSIEEACNFIKFLLENKIAKKIISDDGYENSTINK